MNPAATIPQPSTRAANFIWIAVILVIIFIVLFSGGKLMKGITGIFEGLGLKDSKEEKRDKKEVESSIDRNNSLGNQSAWAPKMYKGITGAKILTLASATTLCKTIYDSVGHIYDEPNKAAGAIKTCYTKTQVSFLCERWQALYGTDLLSWMQFHFDTSEQKKVLNNILTYVENLPLAKPK